MAEESTRFEEFRLQLFKKLEDAKESVSITCPICNQGNWEVVGADTAAIVKLWPDYPGEKKE